MGNDLPETSKMDYWFKKMYWSREEVFTVVLTSIRRGLCVSQLKNREEKEGERDRGRKREEEEGDEEEENALCYST